MRRTQIYLAEEHYRALKERARRRGTTLAAVIREILDESLKGGAGRGKDPFDQVIGIGKGDGEAVAENVDDYLYGHKR